MYNHTNLERLSVLLPKPSDFTGSTKSAVQEALATGGVHRELQNGLT